jgi:hypothetical protein
VGEAKAVARFHGLDYKDRYLGKTLGILQLTIHQMKTMTAVYPQFNKTIAAIA